jgi:ABC-type branched-subunit amino acid transport system substrate-binding protein
MAGRTVVRVALLLPLTSSDREIKQVAKALLDSAQLAVFEVGNPDLLLLPKDTKASAAGAQAAAQEALAQGAELILGPLLRDEVLAVAPMARSANVPVLAFSTDRGVAGNGVYLLSFQPEQEVQRVTEYAVSQGRTAFAAMIPNSDYGARVRDAFVSSVEKSGARVIALQSYERSPASMSDPVRSLADYEKRMALHGLNGSEPPIATSANMTDLQRVQQYQSFGTSPFDAVLLPEGGTMLRALAPLLPYYDVDPHKVKFLGTGLWDDPIIGREPALDGGWFAAPSPDAQNAFLSRFSQAYGTTPPPRIASLSFDAVALAGSLAKLPRGQRFSAQTLTSPNGFTGIDGIFRFTPDGGTERGLAVLEVTSNGFVVVSPAPTTFEGRPSL